MDHNNHEGDFEGSRLEGAQASVRIIERMRSELDYASHELAGVLRVDQSRAGEALHRLLSIQWAIREVSLINSIASHLNGHQVDVRRHAREAARRWPSPVTNRGAQCMRYGHVASAVLHELKHAGVCMACHGVGSVEYVGVDHDGTVPCPECAHGGYQDTAKGYMPYSDRERARQSLIDQDTFRKRGYDQIYAWGLDLCRAVLLG